jgi:uncharacterized protein (DUF1330 family)
MPAYMIVTAKVHDRAQFLEVYGKPATALIGQFGGRYIVRAPGAEALETTLSGVGDGCSMVVSEWPSKDAILAFWNSPQYQALKAARQDLADVDVLMIEQPGA